MMKNKSLRKMKRDFKAISPVVATILLVLVAVAAAVAFYVFESGWQAQQTDNLKNVNIGNQNDISIIGSTTVQPFMDTAAQAYMTDHPGVKITVAGGGSGQGRAVVESTPAGADIGTISEAWTATDASAYSQVKATTIGYDGIVVIIGPAFAYHGITAQDLTNLTTGDVQTVYNAAHGTYTWDAFHALLNPSYVPGTDTHGGQFVVTYERADTSGTEDGFDQFVLNNSAKNFFTSHPADKAVQGNPGMIAGISADNNGIGFTSFGMVAANPALHAFSLNGVACTAASIKAEIANSADPAGYVASRPLNILTPGIPSGVVADFISYILAQDHNKAFNAANGYVSLY